MRACIPHGAVNAHVHVHEGSCSQNVKQIIYNMRIQHGMQSKHPDAGRLLTVYILSRSSTEQNTSSCKHTTLRCGSRKVSFFSFFFSCSVAVFEKNVNVCGLVKSGPSLLLHSSTNGHFLGHLFDQCSVYSHLNLICSITIFMPHPGII